MTAVQHQIEVIELFELGFRCAQWLDDRALRIIDQHQDVRQFQRRTFADLHARWQAFDDRSFGGADQAGGAFGVIVAFQIETQHNAFAGLASHCAFHIDQPIARLKDAFVQVFAHGRLDVLDALALRPVFRDRLQGRSG